MDESIILKICNNVFTSIYFFLQKPGGTGAIAPQGLDTLGLAV
ncbi:MAG TPA: hypothetical protein VK211_19225 [Kamptonema sp.]|nr:hypothetical protein [Kamptonema sp.]